MPYIIIVIGLLITTLGFRMLFQKKEKTSVLVESTQNVIAINPDPITPKQIVMDTITDIVFPEVKPNVDAILDTQIVNTDNAELNKQKGIEFESFVVNHFESKYYDLLEWRGDKYSNGRYASSNQYPDLEIKLKSKKLQTKFAIECKYRSYFFNNGIEWAEDYQLEIYKEYSKEYNMPVFILLGVGGEATKPEEIFIIPLSEINSTFLNKKLLYKYERKRPYENFYYNSEQQVLY